MLLERDEDLMSGAVSHVRGAASSLQSRSDCIKHSCHVLSSFFDSSTKILDESHCTQRSHGSSLVMSTSLSYGYVLQNSPSEQQPNSVILRLSTTSRAHTKLPVSNLHLARNVCKVSQPYKFIGSVVLLHLTPTLSAPKKTQRSKNPQ